MKLAAAVINSLMHMSHKRHAAQSTQGHRTSFALVANFSVLPVSSNWAAAGVMLHTMAMRAPEPDMELCMFWESKQANRQTGCVRMRQQLCVLDDTCIWVPRAVLQSGHERTDLSQRGRVLDEQAGAMKGPFCVLTQNNPSSMLVDCILKNAMQRMHLRINRR